ncbi:PAS domain S-box protein [Candidatus Methanomassiliicoccus intestinalis]|uniref:PAS domain S-box protein n=1 Tax=Candidatus Methanomassiliicoccus intestinalis TaxID=1406512 RepID=UPI0037DC69CA
MQNPVDNYDNNSLENTSPIGHAAVLYGSDDDMISSMIPLLIESVSDENQMCLCILDDTMYMELTNRLAEQGIDIAAAQESERLNHLIKSEIFFTKGVFNLEHTFAIFSSIANASKLHGFKQLNIFTDMSWTLPKVLNRAEYELKLNTLAVPIKLNMVCMYDLRKFSSDAVMDALRTHPTIYANGVKYANPFSTPAERLMHEDFSDLELEYALRIIRNIYDLQSALAFSENNIEQLGNTIKSCNHEKNELSITLNELKLKFDQYAEGISDWIWESDAEGNFNYTSTAVNYLLGVQREEILGKGLTSILIDEDQEILTKALEEAKYRIASFGPLDLRASKNGEIVHLRISAVPLFHRNGTFLGYRGITRDITNEINSDIKIKSLNEEIAGYAASSAETAKTIEELKSSIESKAAEVQSLTENLSSVQNALSAKDLEITRLNDELRIEKDGASEIQEKLASKTMELSILSSSIAAFKEETERLTGKLIAEQNNVSKAQSDFEAYKVESDNERSSLKGELLTVQTELEDTKLLLANKNSEISTLTSAAATLADEKQALASQLDSLREDLSRSTAELTSLTAELEDLKSKYKTEVSSLSDKLTASESELSDLRSSVASKNSEVLTLTAAAALLAEEKQSLESQVGSLQTELKNHRAQTESSDLEINSLTNRNAELQTQLQTTTKMVEELKSSKNSTDLELSSLTEKIVQTENELKAKDDELVSVREALSLKTTQLDSFNKMLDDKNEEITNMLNVISSKEVELNELREKIATLHTDLEAELSAMRNELKTSVTLSIENYYEVLDSSAEAIWVIDNNGVTTFTNRRISEIFGYSKEELHDKKPTDFMNAEWLKAEDRKFLEERVIKFVRKDGSDLWVIASSIPLISHDGVPKGMMGILVDVTELKKSVPQMQKPAPQKDPNDFMESLNDALTSVLSNIALVKDYVIPEGRMYDKLIRVQEASEAAVRAIGYDKLPDLSAPLVHGAGRILIIDDNDAVSESISDLLTHLGYDPEYAADGTEGLELCTEAAADNRPFLAAIVDINIPDCIDQAAKMSAVSPGLKIIATDVLAGDPISAEPTAFGFAAALAKPFSAGELSSLLNKLLSA